MSSIRNTALNYLARREHSVYQLQVKLTDKGYLPEVITPVLMQLIKEGLLSDERYAEQFIYQRFQSGFGPCSIEAGLQKAGIDAAIIHACLARYSLDTWLIVLHKVHRKRFGHVLPENLSEKAKQWRYFSGRGFTREQIHAYYVDLRNS